MNGRTFSSQANTYAQIGAHNVWNYMSDRRTDLRVATDWQWRAYTCNHKTYTDDEDDNAREMIRGDKIFRTWTDRV